MYVSKQLKSLVMAQPHILHGSKDLARKLSQLKLDARRKRWIVSGDIVAYYPNIPLNKCLKIVAQWWLETEGQRVTAEERGLFLSCFFAANRELLIDFDNESAIQIRGLAMGIACSPDLANLYGAHFENPILERDDMKSKVPFFGRYLDDVLGIVYAQSADEALAIARNIAYEDVEIEWSVSEWNTPFLDLFVYLDPITERVEHKPYSKPLNHRERIPWASHHPKDVKKGTFIGEMSRLATLSSRLDHYRDAIGDLMSLYIARGYPTALVRTWVKEYYSKRWEMRLSEPLPRDEVFVLKSHFNPVWSSFNVHELGKVVTDSWLSSLSSLDNLRTSVRGPVAPFGELPSAPARRPKSPSEALEALAGVPGTLAYRDGDWVTSYLLDEWVAAGSPYIPRSLVHQPQLATSLAAKKAAADAGGGSEEPDTRRRQDGLRETGGTTVQGGGGDTSSGEYAKDGHNPSAVSWTGDSEDKATGKLIPSKVVGGVVVESVIDVRTVGFCDKKWIVSRKKTRNLGDIVNTWKKTLLERAVDDDVIHMHVDEWQ